jgi:hypothetical protein
MHVYNFLYDEALDTPVSNFVNEKEIIFFLYLTFFLGHSIWEKLVIGYILDIFVINFRNIKN